MHIHIFLHVMVHTRRHNNAGGSRYVYTDVYSTYTPGNVTSEPVEVALKYQYNDSFGQLPHIVREVGGWESR